MHYRLLAYVVNNYPFIFYDTVKVHRSGHQGVLRLSNWHTPVGYIYNITLYYIILHYKYCNVNNKVHRVQSSMTCVLLTAHNVCSQPDSTKMCSQPDSTKMCSQPDSTKMCSQPDSTKMSVSLTQQRCAVSPTQQRCAVSPTQQRCQSA